MFYRKAFVLTIYTSAACCILPNAKRCLNNNTAQYKHFDYFLDKTVRSKRLSALTPMLRDKNSELTVLRSKTPKGLLPQNILKLSRKKLTICISLIEAKQEKDRLSKEYDKKNKVI